MTTNIKVKVLPRFPSNVTVTTPIVLNRTGGNYAFSFDSTTLSSLIVNADNITLGSQTGTGAMVRATSPTLAGIPTVPTAAIDTNTTQAASTAFVLAQSSAVTPLVATLAGSIGTATRFARSDHTHPASASVTNTRLAKTANYTVANADKFSTIALGGSAYFTLTFNVASGYDANFGVVVTNEDSTVSGGNHTGRGKIIAINGYPNFILWPGQTFTVINQNNAWRFNYPGRWRVQGAPTLFVNHASGNDSNDGLATGSGAFATIQAAVFAYEFYVDCNGFGPTIQNAAETFTENNVTHTRPLTGYHVISITGDTTTPSNVVWQVSGSGNVAINGRDGGLAIVTGFKFVSTGTNNFFLNGGQDGVIDFGSIEFGANAGGYNIYISAGGACNWFGGSLSITGDCSGFILGSSECHLIMDGATVSIPNARAFSNFVQLAGSCNVSMTSMTFTGTGAGAGSTGNKYSVSQGAQLSIASTTLPGVGFGAAFSGGIVTPLAASKTNDAAQTGDIGEVISTAVAVGSAVALTTATPANMTSISLTSGDWDVSANVYFNLNAATSVSNLTASISQTSATLDATTMGAENIQRYTAFVAGGIMNNVIPPIRISLASTTTIYAVAQSTFTVNTNAAYGILRARRCR